MMYRRRKKERNSRKKKRDDALFIVRKGEEVFLPFSHWQLKRNVLGLLGRKEGGKGAALC